MCNIVVCVAGSCSTLFSGTRGDKLAQVLRVGEIQVVQASRTCRERQDSESFGVYRRRYDALLTEGHFSGL
jgi:hypothetical protein